MHSPAPRWSSARPASIAKRWICQVPSDDRTATPKTPSSTGKTNRTGMDSAIQTIECEKDSYPLAGLRRLILSCNVNLPICDLGENAVVDRITCCGCGIHERISLPKYKPRQKETARPHRQSASTKPLSQNQHGLRESFDRPMPASGKRTKISSQ